MRVIVFVKATEHSEKGFTPGPESMARNDDSYVVISNGQSPEKFHPAGLF